MKKIYYLTVLFVAISTITGFSQLICYPGSTWVFQGTNLGVTEYQKWEYAGDSLAGSETYKKLHVMVKSRMVFWPLDSFVTYTYDEFVKESGDTVWYRYNNQWILVANFSYQTGDTVPSPLADAEILSGSDCDSSIYGYPATIEATGTDTVNGIPLRWYELKYRDGYISGDTVFNHRKYYERIMSSYWYASYYASCNIVCPSLPELICYKDSNITGTASCDILIGFETMGTDEELPQPPFVSVYPNPADEQLSISVYHMDDVESYHILNMQGQRISSRNIAGNMQVQADVSFLPAGMYILTLVSEKGKSINTWFVKQ